MVTARLEPVKNLDGNAFFIPSYQRGYRWEETQVKELLDDLYEFAQKHSKMTSDEKEKSYYCLQPIVVKHRPDIGENTWEVIDGQQRLTALWVLRQAISVLGNNFISKTMYTLDYENKEQFSNIFKSIKVLADDNDDISYKKFLEILETKNIVLNNASISPVYEQMKQCIDGRYIKYTFDLIFNYRCKHETIEKKLDTLRKYFTLANSISDIITNDKVKVIWYEIETESAIATFLNLNANKIELTNAELLKAKLFCSISDEKRQMLAHQWEDIERGLHKKAFWNFIANKQYVSGKYKDATKIDYLFEIYIASIDVVLNKDSDRYSIFRKIDADLLNADNICNAVDNLWFNILKIYETLRDWYSDYFYYHTIGLLIDFYGIEKIKELYKSYKDSTKNIFKKEVLKQIKEIFKGRNYFGNLGDDPIENRELIEEKLNSYKYGENDKEIKNVLFLYNIATLVNAQNDYERFPFELYKNNKWTIEHIIPQHLDEEDVKHKAEWIKENCSPNDRDYPLSSDEKEDEELIEIYLLEIDVNKFGNLTLLDSNTNSSYKNKPFSQKRDIIIRIIKNEEKGKGKDEKYLCVGTKWVFLKGHLTEELANNGMLNYWTDDDAKAYVSDVADRICNFFNLY